MEQTKTMTMRNSVSGGSMSGSMGVSASGRLSGSTTTSAVVMEMPSGDVEVEWSVVGSLMTIEDAWYEFGDELNKVGMFVDDDARLLYDTLRRMVGEGKKIVMNPSGVVMELGHTACGGSVAKPLGQGDIGQSHPKILAGAANFGGPGIGHNGQNRQEGQKNVRDVGWCVEVVMKGVRLGCSVLIEAKSRAVYLRNCWERKQLGKIAGKLWQVASSRVDDIESAKQEAVEGLLKIDEGLEKKVMDMSEGLNEVWGIVSQNRQGGNVGIRTGLRGLDGTGGFHYGDLVIIGAESSQGKTSLALNMAMSAMEAGVGVGVFSMEMTGYQIVSRLLAMKSAIPASRLLYMSLEDYQLKSVDEGMTKLRNLPLWIDEGSDSIEAICGSVRRMVVKWGVKMVVVDYLQILNVTGRRMESTEIFMGECARRLKNLAKELGIVVVALSQLRRDAQSPVPSMSRLRASGQISEAADMVILLYRPEAVKNGRKNTYPQPWKDRETSGTAMITLAKNRNGGLTEFLCGFTADLCLFYDCEVRSATGGNTPSPEGEDEDRPF